MSRRHKTKRSFSGISLEDVLAMIAARDFTPWQLNALPRPPSDILVAVLSRFQAFDTVQTEAAKLLLVDAVFGEVVPLHPNLKVWKGAALESDTLIGTADYLIAPKRAYLAYPLLCAAEAKRDDFEQGRTQCVAEMIACRENNARRDYTTDVYGIVSNGQGWQFYKLTLTNEVWETDLYVTSDLPRLLGALDNVCGECAKLVP